MQFTLHHIHHHSDTMTEIIEELRYIKRLMSTINETVNEIVATEAAEATTLAAVKTALEAFIAQNPGVDTTALQAALDAAKANVASASAIEAEIPVTPVEPAA